MPGNYSTFTPNHLGTVGREVLILQPGREITPPPPVNYSTLTPNHLGIIGREAHKHAWDKLVTNNYSKPTGNYSTFRRNHLGTIGREDKREITPPDPVFEIYYYSITTEAKN